MIKISLDTNAVLDFCYRYYAEDVFASIWQAVENQVNSKMLVFYMADAIKAELNGENGKVNSFEYEDAVFDAFITRFQVKIITKETFGNELLQIQQKLLVAPYALKSNEVNIVDNDMSIIALAQQQGACKVLTSEQGFGKHMSYTRASGSRKVKIPDVCQQINIDCINWLGLFKQLGVNTQ